MLNITTSELELVKLHVLRLITLVNLYQMLKQKGSFGSLFCFWLSLSAFAQTDIHYPGEVAPLEEKSEVVKVIENEVPFPAVKLKTEDLRFLSTGSVIVGFNLISTWIPYKTTFAYTHIFSKKWSLELEYASSSMGVPVAGINIGGISEKNYSLLFRNYVGNSFHFVFGPYQSTHRASVGRGYDLGEFEVKNVGLATGFANRWQWKSGMTFGIEWFRMNIPLRNTKYNDGVLKKVPSANDRDDVKKVMDYFNRIPTFTILGLNIGYTF